MSKKEKLTKKQKKLAKKAEKKQYKKKVREFEKLLKKSEKLDRKIDKLADELGIDLYFDFEGIVEEAEDAQEDEPAQPQTEGERLVAIYKAAAAAC